MKRVLPVLYLCCFFPANAHAYAAPGSGAMLWQLAVSFLIGLLFYCIRLLGICSRFFKKAIRAGNERRQGRKPARRPGFPSLTLFFSGGAIGRDAASAVVTGTARPLAGPSAVPAHP